MSAREEFEEWYKDTFSDDARLFQRNDAGGWYKVDIVRYRYEGYLAGVEASAKVVKRSIEENKQNFWCYEQITKLKE